MTVPLPEAGRIWVIVPSTPDSRMCWVLPCKNLEKGGVLPLLRAKKQVILQIHRRKMGMPSSCYVLNGQCLFSWSFEICLPTHVSRCQHSLFCLSFAWGICVGSALKTWKGSWRRPSGPTTWNGPGKSSALEFGSTFGVFLRVLF